MLAIMNQVHSYVLALSRRRIGVLVAAVTHGGPHGHCRPFWVATPAVQLHHMVAIPGDFIAKLVPRHCAEGLELCLIDCTS